MGVSASRGDAETNSIVLLGCKPHSCSKAANTAVGYGDDHDEPMLCGDDPILPIVPEALSRIEEEPLIDRTAGMMADPVGVPETQRAHCEDLPTAHGPPVSKFPLACDAAPVESAKPREKNQAKNGGPTTKRVGAEHKSKGSAPGTKRPLPANPPATRTPASEPKTTQKQYQHTVELPATTKQGGCPHGKCQAGGALLPGQNPAVSQEKRCPLAKVTQADVEREFQKPKDPSEPVDPRDPGHRGGDIRDPLDKLSAEERRKVVARAKQKAAAYDKLGANVEQQCQQQ